MALRVLVLALAWLLAGCGMVRVNHEVHTKIKINGRTPNCPRPPCEVDLPESPNLEEEEAP